jgi:tRNA threonylcarbamoyladenosine biosynthesis protein TsaE
MSEPDVVTARVPTSEAMRAIGARLAGVLRAGDVVLLTGDLGAGKTTLTQGIATGLGVRDAVTSPTFVIAREHAAGAGRPVLVHVDAYRLSGPPELDDLDLDTALEKAVTVVEWGAGVAEGLADNRLEVAIYRHRGGEPGNADDETRRVRIVGVGPRWSTVPLRSVVGGAESPHSLPAC